MRQIMNNTNGFNQSRNSLNSSFQAQQNAFHFQNVQRLRENSIQYQNTNYPLNSSTQNIQFSAQNFQGVNPFCCVCDGHEGNPLNLVCIDKDCNKKGVICTLCMHYEHQKHETLPLQIFLLQFRDQLTNLISQNQLDTNGSTPIDVLLEQVMQIQNDVIQSLKIFSQKTFEAIQKTKDYLYQIFLQEVHGYQTLEMRVSDLTETIKMYEQNNIKNSSHHIEQIQKMVQKIQVLDNPELTYKNGYDMNFILEVIPQQQSRQLENIHSSMQNVQENIENEIQEMHQQIQLSLQNILDFSTLPKQSIESFTLNGQSNQPSSAHFMHAAEPVKQNIFQISTSSSNRQQTASTSAQTKPQSSSSSQFQNQQIVQQSQNNYQRSVSSGLPPPSQGSSQGSKQQIRGLHMRNSSNLNNSFQSESSQFNNIGEYQPTNMHTQQSRRRETHLLSRSYASSTSPKESPSKNNMRQYTNTSTLNKQSSDSKQMQSNYDQQSSSHNLKGAVSQTPNFTINTEGLSLTSITKIQAHNNVIRDMIDVGGNKFATCSYDSNIKLWNKNNYSLIQELKGHTDEVYQLSYSNKHNLLASSSYDKTIRIWKEYSEWKQLVTLRGHTGKTWAVKFIDQSNKLATGGNDRIIRIWNIFNGECENLLDGHQDTIWSLFILNDGVRMASGDNKYIKIWDYKVSKVIKSIQAHEDRIYQLKEIPLQKKTKQFILISTSMDRKVKIWDSKNYSLLYSFSEQFIITSLEMVVEKNIIILGLWGDKKEGGIAFWHLPFEQSAKENYSSEKQPQKIRDYMGNYSGVSSLIYDSDQQNLFTSHSNGCVEIINLKWK